MEYRHIPVMLSEVLNFSAVQLGDKVIDCTLGGAGYTQALAEAVGETGQVFSFDLDPLAIKNAQTIIHKKKIKNIKLINDNFANLQNNLLQLGQTNDFQAIVMDLGLSSAQLDDEQRGFSFRFDAPLNMSFAGEHNNKTEEIINLYSEKKLEKIIREYGEERYAKNIARAIVIARQSVAIKTTKELVEIIKKVLPYKYRYNSRIHFATKTFQALRIASNEELDNLTKVLPQALNLLRSGGRLLVVSFHSLEDRIVKNFFKKESRDCLCPPEIPVCRCEHQAQIKIITKKPVLATQEENEKNPRARSAKLRVAEKK